MKIALIQFDPTKSDFQGNQARALKLVSEIKEVDLILLPELWAVGFMNFDHFITYAQKITGPLVTEFQKIAKEKNTDIFMGSFVEECDRKYYNTSVYINKQGNILTTYRKIHLFTVKSREAEILTAGSQTSLGSTHWGSFALATCYDLRFPELFRSLQNKGANLFIVPAAWPAKRVHHFKLFCQSRAVENLSFLIGVNCCGGDDNKKLGGNSIVVDPFGEIILEAGDLESVLYADLDLEKIEYWRSNFSALKDKKSDAFWKS